MLDGEDIRLAMDYVQLSANVLVSDSISNDKVKKAAEELMIKSLTVLKDSLVRAGANAAGIITQ